MLSGSLLSWALVEKRAFSRAFSMILMVREMVGFEIPKRWGGSLLGEVLSEVDQRDF